MVENGWGAWENLVLDKLKQNDEAHATLNEQLLKIHMDIATLKTGARISGAIAGFLAATVVSLIGTAVALFK